MLSFPRVTLKKGTKVWLIVFAGSAAATAILKAVRGDLGCLGSLTAALAICSALVLLVFGIVAAFRAIVRRLTLRLAFSYFLIGVVPIPLLAMLLFAVAYLFVHQFMATRVRREVRAVAQDLAARGKASAVLLQGETVETSEVPWLKSGDKAPWAASLDTPRPVIGDNDIWIAMRRAPTERQTLLLVKAGDPEFLRRLADQAGYPVRIERGRSRERRSGEWSFSTEPAGRPEGGDFTRGAIPSPDPAKSARGYLDREWIGAIYVDKAAFSTAHSGGDDVVVFIAKTSLRVLQEPVSYTHLR